MHRIINVPAAAATATITMGAGNAAFASVTTDANGNGFIGNGDVQTAPGSNNKTLQDNTLGLYNDGTQA